MSSLFKKLTELEDMKHEQEISTLLTSVSEEKLLSLIKIRLIDSAAPRGLSIIFNFFGCSNVQKRKRKLNIINALIEEIPKQAALTTVQVRDITNAILVELENLDTDSLIQLVTFCTKQMQENDTGKETWKEMLPRLLLLLKEKPVVSHCGHEMSGADYRSQVVKSLCNGEWKSDSVTMIAAMFRELPMVGDEFKQVVDKLLNSLDELDASEVPPFVYQILRLCGNQYFLLVLMHVQRYYSKHMTSSIVNLDADSIESVGGDVAMTADTKQSESTVLFHIQKCAAQEPQSSKNLASTLSQLAFCPEIVFGTSTFLLSSALMICDVEILREKYTALLVNGLVRCVQDEELRRKHVWTGKVLAPQNRLEACLKKLIENTDIQRGVILEQFVKFCFEVLVNKKTGRACDKILETVANALMHVVKKQPDAVSVILELLVCNIMRSKCDPQLLRCLKKLVIMTPAKLLMKTEFISINMVEHLVNMQPQMAEQAIVALIPLLSRSEGLCNNLIVNLRKAINRPLVATRQMAVTGLITMIQRLRIKKFNLGGSQALQYYSSSSSVCSQMTGEITLHGAAATKDLQAVNLELMQILTHALFCQADVRLRLYEGVHVLPSQNNDLGPVVLQFLFKNLAKCREINGAGIIDYEKCYKETMEEEIVLVEPVGHLIFSIAMVITHMKISDIKVTEEISTLMDSLVERMTEISTTDLGFDKDHLVIEEGAKGDKKVLVLTLGMNVCEAIIAYLIKTWADSKDQCARKVLAVFKTYISIQDHIKGCKRPNKKKDPNNSAVGSQGANPRKRGRTASSSFAPPKEKGAKDIGGVLLSPVLDLQILHLLLELLFCDQVEWADASHATLLQNKQNFVSWALSSLIQAINHFKILSCNGLLEKSSAEFNSFCHIGRILFEFLSNSKIKDVFVDTPDVAILLLEGLFELVALFQHDNHTLFGAFIASSGNGNVADSVEQIIGHLIKVLGGLITLMENNDDLDVNFKKLPRLTLAILNQLTSLLEHGNPATDQLAKCLQKIAKENTCADEQVVKATLDLLMAASELRGRSTGALTLLTRDVLSLLGPIEEMEEEVEKKLLLIGDTHANVVIQVICSHIRGILELTNTLIQRLRSERCLHPYQINEECEQMVLEVSEKEMNVSESLTSLLDVVKILLNTKMPVEQGDTLLKDVCAIYRTLTNYCRHFAKFSNRVETTGLRRSKFQGVVVSAGRNLPPLITTFISHLEEKQKEKYEDMQGKKKFNAKVAQKKVLRESDTFARTMLEYERFSKAVFQLSAKLKDPSLKDSLHLGASHDYRLNYADLTKRLKDLEEEDSENEDENDEDD